MPVYNSRDLIPFVNELEERIEALNSGLDSWQLDRGKVMSSIENIPANTNRSTLAMVKADEALAELGSATFGVVAGRGQRLKTLIDSLREEMVDIAKTTEGRGGKGYDPRINAEIDNAVAEVDSVIADGLKLDYRLREIQKLALSGGSIADKELILPYSIEVNLQDIIGKSIQLDEIENMKFVNGDVTVLDFEKNPIIHPTGQMITGTVTDEGLVEFNFMPLESVKIYFPLEVALRDVPKDIVYYLIDTLVEKNSEHMRDLLTIQQAQEKIAADIQAMKGQNWTVDFSIMRNHQEIVQEGITPKGLHTEVVDGMAHVTFSYNDHPYLSHWELEKWDEEQQKFVPYDGKQGILSK